MQGQVICAALHTGQDPICQEVQRCVFVLTGQKTGRCVPSAGGTEKSSEMLAWCPAEEVSVGYGPQRWAVALGRSVLC